MNSDQNNILITGPSRSGTSLACSILNESRDCVALNEPFRIEHLGKKSLKDDQFALQRMLEFIPNTRKTLIETGSAPSKGGFSMNNSDPASDIFTHSKDGFLSRFRKGLSSAKSRGNNRELREIVHRIKTHRVDKELSSEFRLILKHNLLFTALLNSLSHEHECFAIVRNPLSTIISWNTVNFGLGEGRLPKWFKYWLPETNTQIMKESDIIDRQITILEWKFKQYEQILPPDHILTYEDIIASGGMSLSKAIGIPDPVKVPLESRNQNALYPQALKQEVAERLIKRDGVLWSFYDKNGLEVS